MSWKRRIRSLADRTAVSVGIVGACERRSRRGLTILMYHRVLEDAEALAYPFASLAMPARAFAEQARWLARNCEVVTLTEGLRSPSYPSARPRVAITFDDGYRDNHAIAAPILESAGVRGTFFVTTGFVAAGRPLWFDRAFAVFERSESNAVELAFESAPRSLTSGPIEAAPDARTDASEDRQEFARTRVERLKALAPASRDELLDRLEAVLRTPVSYEAYRPMTPGEVEDLARRGHEIGSHSVNHAILPLLADEELQVELAESRATLANWIGGPVEGFCYPNGDHDTRVVAATRAAGYAYACGTSDGLNGAEQDPFRLARVDITPRRVLHAGGEPSTVAFRAEISRWRAGLRRLRA